MRDVCLVVFVLFVACKAFPTAAECGDGGRCPDGSVCSAGECIASDSVDGALASDANGDIEVDAAVPVIDRCGFEFAESDRCGACIADNCCNWAARCLNEAACEQLVSCVGHCGQHPDLPGCFRGCAPTGATVEDSPNLVGTVLCTQQNCADQCGTCGIASLGVGGTCRECLRNHPVVCNAYRDCSADLGCGEAALCGAACKSPDCVMRCANPMVVVGTQPMLIGDILEDHCASACDSGTNWDCIDQYSWAGSDTGRTVQIVIRIVTRPDSGPDSEAVGNLRVRACERSDRTCEDYKFDTVSLASGEASGQLDMDLSGHGFEGYFLVGDPTNPAPAFMPIILMPGRPLVDDTELGVVMTTIDQVSGRADIADITFDPSRAHLRGTMHDCTARHAPNMKVSLVVSDTRHQTIYHVRGIPDASAQHTDQSGNFNVLNIDPGHRNSRTQYGHLTASFSGTESTAGEEQVLLRAGHITHVLMFPRSSTPD